MDLQEYEALEKHRLEINIGHMENGVNFVDLRTAYIDETVKIGRGTTIGPCVILEGNVTIGKDSTIGQNSKIVDSVIGEATIIENSVIMKSKVGDKTSVGPFAYIRPDSEVGNGCKVGDFVEIKNSTMGDGSKAAHLTYVGDADLGKNINLGCGVVFVNYDGSNKYRTTVKDGAFIGCNTNLVSPVVIEEKAYIAAGSTVTRNVPGGALYVARSKGKLLEGWVEKRGILNRKKNK
ncbi:MAG: UDP-N-acetylglucosamine diphosphorylase [Anaerovoracaceae bacterium]